MLNRTHGSPVEIFNLRRLRFVGFGTLRTSLRRCLAGGFPKDLIGMSYESGISPTILFFSDGIKTINPTLGKGLDS